MQLLPPVILASLFFVLASEAVEVGLTIALIALVFYVGFDGSRHWRAVYRNLRQSTDDLWRNLKWSRMGNRRIEAVAVCDSKLAVMAAPLVHFTDDPSVGDNTRWELLGDIPASQMAAASDMTIGVISVLNQQVYLWNRDQRTWQSLPGQAKQLAIGSKTQMAIIGLDDYVYEWQANAWVRSASSRKARSIAMGRDGTFLYCDMEERVYRRVEDGWQAIAKDVFTQIGVQKIACSDAQHIFGIRGSQSLLRWNGKQFVIISTPLGIIRSVAAGANCMAIVTLQESSTMNAFFLKYPDA